MEAAAQDRFTELPTKVLDVTMDHYDALETRSAEEREAALMSALPVHIAHAKKAPGFAPSRQLSGPRCCRISMS